MKSSLIVVQFVVLAIFALSSTMGLNLPPSFVEDPDRSFLEPLCNAEHPAVLDQQSLGNDQYAVRFCLPTKSKLNVGTQRFRLALVDSAAEDSKVKGALLQYSSVQRVGALDDLAAVDYGNLKQGGLRSFWMKRMFSNTFARRKTVHDTLVKCPEQKRPLRTVCYAVKVVVAPEQLLSSANGEALLAVKTKRGKDIGTISLLQLDNVDSDPFAEVDDLSKLLRSGSVGSYDEDYSSEDVEPVEKTGASVELTNFMNRQSTAASCVGSQRILASASVKRFEYTFAGRNVFVGVNLKTPFGNEYSELMCSGQNGCHQKRRSRVLVDAHGVSFDKEQNVLEIFLEATVEDKILKEPKSIGSYELTVTVMDGNVKTSDITTFQVGSIGETVMKFYDIEPLATQTVLKKSPYVKIEINRAVAQQMFPTLNINQKSSKWIISPMKMGMDTAVFGNSMSNTVPSLVSRDNVVWLDHSADVLTGYMKFETVDGEYQFAARPGGRQYDPTPKSSNLMYTSPVKFTSDYDEAMFTDQGGCSVM